MTDNSVDVVSRPQNADQSLATRPAPMTSLPLLTVPATRGTCKSDESSSRSSIDVCGCTCNKSDQSDAGATEQENAQQVVLTSPPWFVKVQ